MDSIDALVIGAGPVGLTMAAELTRYGLSVRVIDKAAARTDKSKALVMWSRTIEHLDAMGCAERFIAAGMKVTHASIFAGRRRVAHFDFSGVDSPYPYGLFIPQSETERLLDQHLAYLGRRIERSVELVGFEQDGSGVTATLARSDGTRETVRSSWLLGCDGAHSTVRHLLQLPFMGETEPSDWVLADVHLSGSIEPEVMAFWNPHGLLAIFPIAPGRYRIIADRGMAQSDKRTDPTLDEVQQLLDERGPGGLKAHSPIWLSAFRINERKVKDYRVGRVFLAGDAAHVHSPAGGQGMNTGMQDACGLAWRLGLVQRGLGRDAALLDSYSSERSAIGDMVLRNAGRLTRIAIMRNPLQQFLRNNLFALLIHLPPVQRKAARILTETDLAYPESPLSRAGEGAPGKSAAGGPGERAGNIPLHDGEGRTVSLHTLLRKGRLVIVDGGDLSGSRDIAVRYGRCAITAASVTRSGGIAVVRPDGYVGLVARSGDWAAVERYLGELLVPAAN